MRPGKARCQSPASPGGRTSITPREPFSDRLVSPGALTRPTAHCVCAAAARRHGGQVTADALIQSAHLVPTSLVVCAVSRSRSTQREGGSMSSPRDGESLAIAGSMHGFSSDRKPASESMHGFSSSRNRPRPEPGRERIGAIRGGSAARHCTTPQWQRPRARAVGREGTPRRGAAAGARRRRRARPRGSRSGRGRSLAGSARRERRRSTRFACEGR